MVLEQLAFLRQQIYNCESPENLYAGVLSDRIYSLQDWWNLEHLSLLPDEFRQLKFPG